MYSSEDGDNGPLISTLGFFVGRGCVSGVGGVDKVSFPDGVSGAAPSKSAPSDFRLRRPVAEDLFVSSFDCKRRPAFKKEALRRFNFSCASKAAFPAEAA